MKEQANVGAISKHILVIDGFRDLKVTAVDQPDRDINGKTTGVRFLTR